MNNHQRGVYQPLVENIPIYDLTEDEAEDEERSRLPLLIIIGLVVLAAFTGVVWLAYNQGVERGRSGAVVITPPDGPVRTAPTDPQTGTPGAGYKIYSTPVPVEQEVKGSALAANTPSAPTTEAPPVRLVPGPAPAAPAPRVAAPAPAVPAPAAPAPRVAAPAPAPVAPAVPAPAPRVVAPAPAIAAPAAPPAPPAAAIPAAPPAVAAEPAHTATLSGFVLQLGSYQTPALAEAGWNTFRNRYAEVAGPLADDVQRVDLGQKGIWYRLRVGSFADRPAAVAACEKLKSLGGACFVTAP